MNEEDETKLRTLADQYAHTVDELLIEWGLESLVPSICMNPDCEYTTEYEPDQRAGWCGACGTESVKSFLVLLELL
ncbi:MAG TPA: hypothetical protein VF173_12475 [Thermoanaerobaculia bacterium]|nr:hypothetical protein [Thermoanaerobaculia bacterium]